MIGHASYTLKDMKPRRSEKLGRLSEVAQTICKIAQSSGIGWSVTDPLTQGETHRQDTGRQTEVLGRGQEEKW